MSVAVDFLFVTQDEPYFLLICRMHTKLQMQHQRAIVSFNSYYTFLPQQFHNIAPIKSFLNTELTYAFC